MVQIQFELVIMVKYKPKGKGIYTDVIMCEGCGEMHFDDEECVNMCFLCEYCLEYHMIDDIDAGLLMDRNMSICLDCGLKQEVWTEATNKNKSEDKTPIMGDADGN